MLVDGESLTLTNTPEFPISTISGGKARGKLIGGNLAVFVGLLGSSFLPTLDEFAQSILFLEEVNEEPERIDRYLTQLHLAGILDVIQGFVFGQCTNCQASVPSQSLTWQQVVQTRLSSQNYPSFMGAMFGHELPQQYILPIGALVEINAFEGTIKMLEPAVRVRT